MSTDLDNVIANIFESCCDDLVLETRSAVQLFAEEGARFVKVALPLLDEGVGGEGPVLGSEPLFWNLRLAGLC